MICITLTPALYAQESVGNSNLTLGIGTTIPTGSESFTSDPTFVSPYLMYEYFVMDDLSLGLSLGYRYSKEDGQTRDHINGDLIDGYSERKLTQLPIQIQARYYPVHWGRHKNWSAYVTIAGGIQFNKYFLVGDQIHRSKHEKWTGVFTPDVGVRFNPVNCKIYLDARLSWGMNKGWEMTTDKTQQNLGVHIGVGMKIF